MIISKVFVVLVLECPLMCTVHGLNHNSWSICYKFKNDSPDCTCMLADTDLVDSRSGSLSLFLMPELSEDLVKAS